MNPPRFDVIEGSAPAQQEAAAWFARLLADDASEHDRQQWRAWMQRAAEHREAYARIEAMWSALGAHAHAPETASRLRQVLARPARAGRWRQARGKLTALAAATVAAALLVGTLLTTQLAAPETLYATAVGEHRSLRLADGSRVDLDTDARLRVQFGRHERKLTLERGRAFFRVAHDAARPLRVEAGAGSVRAVGTEFEVARRADAIDVALYEGKVELMSSATSLRKAVPLAMLAAGQSARVANREVTFTGPVQRGGTPPWLNGRLVFNDQPLAEVVAEFNRYSTEPLRLADPALGTRRISGSFRSDDPAGFVEALDLAYGITHQRRADGSVELKGQR